ncbi:MAG: argininosuccinate lyase [Pseudomonadota bacterium]
MQKKNKKLRGGGFKETASPALEAFWNSISFDCRLAVLDIQGSIAHADMLGHTGIIPKADARKIIGGLKGILKDVEAGTAEFRLEDEDIHMNVERLLHGKIGAVAGKLHTARSRNDQVALDMHLYARQSCSETTVLLKGLIDVLAVKAEENIDTVMPGYTHLQRAQPVLFAHHLLAYAWMFLRDIRRLGNCAESLNVCPLGAGALAGTTFPVDRWHTAKALGFEKPYPNSMDAVGNRDYIVELLAANALIACHLSRLCEEIVLWVSSEFGFVSLGDAYCTGSSMMPQKKNADLAELVRGKTGRVYGDLFTMLTVLKGLPLTYNKDFQEDKECLFDSVDTVKQSLFHIAGMLKTMKARPEKMMQATREGFLNATDAADYLAAKGLPFREAHAVAAKMVRHCLEAGKTLDALPLEEFRKFSPLFDKDIFRAIDIRNVVAKRKSFGGTGPEAVMEQLRLLKKERN